MKIKNLAPIVVGVGLLFLGACQQDETAKETTEQSVTENTYAKNWQEADLSTVFTGKEISYNISPQQLQEVVADKKVTQVRFIPGVVNNEVLVTVVGVDKAGAIVTQITKKPTTGISIATELQKVQDITFNKTAIDDKLVAYHTLQPEEALQFVTSWNTVVRSKSNIDEVTSYNGERIRHYSMDAEMVAHMAGLPVQYINLSWGLNKESKLTTVFVTVTGNSVKLLNKGDEGGDGQEGGVYDFSHPCPPLCDQINE